MIALTVLGLPSKRVPIITNRQIFQPHMIVTRYGALNLCRFMGSTIPASVWRTMGAVIFLIMIALTVLGLPSKRVPIITNRQIFQPHMIVTRYGALNLCRFMGSTIPASVWRTMGAVIFLIMIALTVLGLPSKRVPITTI